MLSLKCAPLIHDRMLNLLNSGSGRNRGYFIPVGCLIASVASDTPIFVATSSAHLPAHFKDSASFTESFASAAHLAVPIIPHAAQLPCRKSEVEMKMPNVPGNSRCVRPGMAPLVTRVSTSLSSMQVKNSVYGATSWPFRRRSWTS